jgi:hypothetical protein
LLGPDDPGPPLVSIARQCLDPTVPWWTNYAAYSALCALPKTCMLFLGDANTESQECWRRGTRAVLLASYVGWLFQKAQETCTLACFVPASNNLSQLTTVRHDNRVSVLIPFSTVAHAPTAGTTILQPKWLASEVYVDYTVHHLTGTATTITFRFLLWL